MFIGFLYFLWYVWKETIISYTIVQNKTTPALILKITGGVTIHSSRLTRVTKHGLLRRELILPKGASFTENIHGMQ